MIVCYSDFIGQSDIIINYDFVVNIIFFVTVSKIILNHALLRKFFINNKLFVCIIVIIFKNSMTPFYIIIAIF